MYLPNDQTLTLWQDVIREAEQTCTVRLQQELESYLIRLLSHYMDKPELINQVLALGYLQALQANQQERSRSFQHVGDQCLLFAGLFPQAAEKRLVKISYFVKLGRSAYATISHQTNDLYGLLATQFVVLMDVLQCVRANTTLLPLEAYELWDELGSQRALSYLTQYTNITPIKWHK